MTFDEFKKEWQDATPYINAHTSGSTGKPKNILLSKEFVKASALRTNDFFSITSSSRLHSCVAADFIGGKMMWVRAEVAKCRFTYETPSNRPLTLLGENERITVLSVVPSQMIYILDNLGHLPEVENYLIGGAAIPPELKNRIASAGLTAYESYGMTETASHIALRRVEREEGWFETLPGIEVELDERECLIVKFNTGERFTTNDIATLESPTRFRIKGRHDNVIISGGKKIHPEELEKRISSLFSCGFLITSRKDEKWGESVVLILEEERGEKTEEEILSAISSLVDRWEVPKTVEWVSHLERTANGKIKRTQKTG